MAELFLICMWAELNRVHAHQTVLQENSFITKARKFKLGRVLKNCLEEGMWQLTIAEKKNFYNLCS